MSDDSGELLSQPADPLVEIEAMRRVAEALSGLDHAALARVLRWAGERFGRGNEIAPTRGATRVSHVSDDSASDYEPIAENDSEFEELADLYARCTPRTDAQKALVVCYWMQEIEEAKGIDARRVNNELKQLGYGVGNITRAFDRLIRERPQLVIQTKKAGTSKQARKTYKLTMEGRLAVEGLMRRNEAG